MRYQFEFVGGDPPTEPIFDFITCRTSELKLSTTSVRLLQRFNFGATYLQGLYKTGLRAFEADFCLEGAEARTEFLRFFISNSGVGIWTLYPYSVGTTTIDAYPGDFSLVVDTPLWASYRGFEYFGVYQCDKYLLFKPASATEFERGTKLLFDGSLGVFIPKGTRIYLFSRFRFINTELSVEYRKGLAVAKNVRLREYPPDLELA